MTKRLLAPALFLLLLGSCKKYEDGPSVSLYSKKSRVANNWMVDQYFLNGVDRTFDYRTIVQREALEFFKSGSWQYSEVSNWEWTKSYDTGRWNLLNSKENLEMISNDPSVRYRIMKILRLKTDELWLEEQVSPDSLVEIHYVPKIE
jgi:hypothetical protein